VEVVTTGVVVRTDVVEELVCSGVELVESRIHDVPEL